MYIRTLFATLIILTAGAAFSYGQLGGGSAAQYDGRVKRALDAAGLKYTIDSDGDFKLEFDLDNGRTQIVFINTKTYTYDNFEIREVWSPGYQSTSQFSANVATRLLADNMDKKIGAWQTMRLNGKVTAVFAAKVAADMTAEQLRSILKAVSRSADAMEKELVGTDLL